MSQGEIRITLTQQADYQFLIDFGPNLPSLLADEPEPLGHGLRTTAAAARPPCGNC